MSMLSKIVKKNAGGLKRLATRTIPGAGMVLGGLDLVKKVSGGGGKKPVYTGKGPGLDFGDIGQLVSRALPGGKHGKPRVSPDASGRCPSGYHPCSDGQDCCKNRKMNPCNGRAVGRAVRRIKKAEKQYRRVFTVLRKQAPGKIMPKRKR